MKDINITNNYGDDELIDKVDWSKAWSKKYPILASYQDIVDKGLYEKQIILMLDDLKNKYGFNELDAMLVLKDLLYQVWKRDKKNNI
ncbi:MAG: hypothetical protein WBO70_02445 [Erysipelotrichaceae bacterium]